MKLMPYVKRLEGKSNIERKQITTDILSKLGIKYKLEKYSYLGYEGENIIVTLGKGTKQILAVTHYDVVPGSPGANDNASTIAVVFDVLKRLRTLFKISGPQKSALQISRELKRYKPKNKIKIIIFGDEEVGCIGSRAYIKKHGVKNILAVYDMELVGMGDAIGIWPVTKDVKNSPALENLRKTIKDLGHYYEEVGKLPLFYGDYLPFRQSGVKDAFCISVASKKEKEAIRQFVETPRLLLTIKLGLGLVKIPKMFQLYHSPEDKSKYLSESALQMTSNVLFNAIVNMDSFQKI